MTSTGPAGERGKTGDHGQRGDRGEVGATGLTGDVGEAGDVGETGAQGVPGPVGKTGLRGRALTLTQALTMFLLIVVIGLVLSFFLERQQQRLADQQAELEAAQQRIQANAERIAENRYKSCLGGVQIIEKFNAQTKALIEVEDCAVGGRMSHGAADSPLGSGLDLDESRLARTSSPCRKAGNPTMAANRISNVGLSPWLTTVS